MKPSSLILHNGALYAPIPVETLDNRPHYRIHDHLYSPLRLLRAFEAAHDDLPPPAAVAPDRAELARLLASHGHDLPTISRAMALPLATVHDLCRKVSARAHAADLHAKGLSYTEIGFAMGISRQRAHQLVTSHAHANNLPHPTKVQRAARRATAAALHAQGLTYQEIGLRMNTSRQYAYSLVKAHRQEQAKISPETPVNPLDTN